MQLDAFGLSGSTILWIILGSGWLIVAFVMQTKVLSQVRPLTSADRRAFYAIEHILLIALVALIASAAFR